MHAWQDVSDENSIILMAIIALTTESVVRVILDCCIVFQDDGM
jgi:hypothetical protein